MRRGGENGLQRNILAENILENFKELETLHTKERNQLAEMYEKHGEIMNVVFSYVLFYIFYCCLASQSAQLLSNLRIETRYLLRSK